MLSMIFACDEEGAIGKDGDLPWRQSSDLQFFKRTTLNKTVVMGRKTWDSLGRPLPKRRNIVMTRSGLSDDVETMSFEEVVELAENEEVVIIGGGEIYALFLPHAKEVHRTIIPPEGFHMIGERRVPAGERDEFPMTFQHWVA